MDAPFSSRLPHARQLRSIVAHTPLEDQLLFRQMSGFEALSRLFEFNVELVASNYNIDLNRVLGQPLTLEIQTLSGVRFLNGQVTRFEMVGQENDGARHYIYRANVRPCLWNLTQTSDNKIFQKKTVPEIIREVLSEHDCPFELNLADAYRDWEYCVQYQETDFAFLSRLMEHEGIYYYFRHANGQHTLVMTDHASSHTAMPGYDVIPYYGPDRLAKPQQEYISMWEVAAQITPDSYATVDYDFTKPRACLDAISSHPGGSQTGDLQMFEWQGGFQEPDHGEQYARIRLQQLQSEREQSRGITNGRGIAPGHIFSLKGHPRSTLNRDYLVVSANYQMSISGYATGTDLDESFQTSFVAVPCSTQYRAARITPVPRTHGPQTATVVGPAGEELWTDQFGRVKVQFHWDRYGVKNENSSCWVRVSSPWAGGGFGGLQLPRINDEVVVDFIGGCPDRPLVLGRVYNASNMPPVSLPANASQSGFWSQSVHGDPSTANWLLFEDKLGAELAHMKAQLNMLLEINNDCNHHIGNNHTTSVGGDQHLTVQKDTYITRQGITNEQLNAAVKREINANYDTIIKGVLNSEHMGDLIDKRTGDIIRKQIGAITQTVEGNIVSDLTGNKTTSQNGNLTQTIVGLVEQTITGNQNKTSYGDKHAIRHGNERSENYGDKTSYLSGVTTNTAFGRQTFTQGYAINACPATATANGATLTVNGATLTLTGVATSIGKLGITGYVDEKKLLGTLARATAAEQRMIAVEQSVKTVSQSNQAIKGTVAGMYTKMAGVRNHLGALTNRVSALDSTT